MRESVCVCVCVCVCEYIQRGPIISLWILELTLNGRATSTSPLQFTLILFTLSWIDLPYLYLSPSLSLSLSLSSVRIGQEAGILFSRVDSYLVFWQNKIINESITSTLLTHSHTAHHVPDSESSVVVHYKQKCFLYFIQFCRKETKDQCSL